MPKFQVMDTFESPNRQLFVMAGSVVQGEVQPGMWVNVPCSEFMTVRAPILELETATRSGREDVCLHVGSGLGRILREDGVDIRGQTIEITPTRIKPKGTLNLHDRYESHALTQQEFKCVECGLARQPEPKPDEPYAEALVRLAEEARTSGWHVPPTAPDGTVDLVTCYCPACGRKRELKAGAAPPD